jgi:hypothetical protein
MSSMCNCDFEMSRMVTLRTSVVLDGGDIGLSFTHYETFANSLKFYYGPHSKHALNSNMFILHLNK